MIVDCQQGKAVKYTFSLLNVYFTAFPCWQSIDGAGNPNARNRRAYHSGTVARAFAGREPPPDEQPHG
jgi:hypothetical protein